MTRQPGLPRLATQNQRKLLGALIEEIDELGGSTTQYRDALKDEHLLARDASDYIGNAMSDKADRVAAAEREKPSRERRSNAIGHPAHPRGRRGAIRRR